MILNQHIRNDYPNWGVERTPRNRVTTMCGKMTLAKYAGIPGISQKPVHVDLDSRDFGWCLECSGAFMIEVMGFFSQIADINNGDLVNLYKNAIDEVRKHLDAINKVAMSPN